MGNIYKNAVIVTLNEDITEISDLADSLDYKIIKTFIQKRETPDVNSYVGSGKLEEIKKFLEESEKKIDLMIIDGDLKPSQWFKLEKELDIEVYDRIRLILAIFAERAERKEAKLQVKLAQLQYERPFVKELIHRARSGEHPGFMAGGEYQVDDYYETIKKQMKKTKEELESISEQRNIRRRYRYKSGFYIVSLAGYTNAGKSSLLNLLSDEKIKVEDKLFSTLSTTTRKIQNNNLPILITDTVGFIKNLPSYIIDAFHSTLEEIEVADVVVLVVDASEDKITIADKLKVSFDELAEIGVTSPIIIALNKIDLVKEEYLFPKVDYIKNNFLTENRKIVVISIKNRKNIDELLESIYKFLPHLVKFKIKLPLNSESQSFISWIFEKANVLDITYENYAIITVESNVSLRDKILSKTNLLNGELLV